MELIKVSNLSELPKGRFQGMVAKTPEQVQAWAEKKRFDVVWYYQGEKVITAVGQVIPDDSELGTHVIISGGEALEIPF